MFSGIIPVMKCPFCSGYLRQVRTKSAVVDVCHSCGGIWFDDGELARFAKVLSASEKITPPKTTPFKHRNFNTVYESKEKDKY